MSDWTSIRNSQQAATGGGTRSKKNEQLVEPADDRVRPARGVRAIDDRDPDCGMAHGSDNEENDRGDHVCGTGLGSWMMCSTALRSWSRRNGL